MHPTARHSAADCREIQKLAKRVSGRREQSSKDGSPPPRQRPGKEKASDSGAAAGEKELGYQSPAREIKGVYHDDDSDSDNGDRRKKLYVMYGGSWELVSRWDVKTLRREVLSAKPGVPKSAPLLAPLLQRLARQNVAPRDSGSYSSSSSCHHPER